MASSSSSCRCLAACFLPILYLLMLVSAAESNSAFFFKNFGKDSNFESQLALYGDAMVANDSMVQIAGSGVSRTGMIISKKPISLIEVISGNVVSVSTYFVFSMSGEDMAGLAFIMLPFVSPADFSDGGSIGMLVKRKLKCLAVEFDNVVVDLGSLVSVKVRNFSSINLEVKSGEKLQTWIDYEASRKRFEVRLNKFGDKRPVDPLLSVPIDLSKMWEDKTVSVGLSSSSRNSSHKCDVYSWSFRTRTIPHWMHSKPLNPENFVGKEEEVRDSRGSHCAWRVFAALILGTGCGVLGAFFVLLMLAIFGNRRPVVPEEYAVQEKELDYNNKLNVSVRKTIEDGNKE